VTPPEGVGVTVTPAVAVIRVTEVNSPCKCQPASLTGQAGQAGVQHTPHCAFQLIPPKSLAHPQEGPLRESMVEVGFDTHLG
jgi:hypothetical protein